MISHLIPRPDLAYRPWIRSGSNLSIGDDVQPGGPGAVTPVQSETKNNTRTDSISPLEKKSATGKDKAVTGAVVNKIQLNEAELAMVRELKQRDLKVRQHEMAHLAASGGLAQGGPSYSYQRGPDGQNYAIGGHVNIDTSPGKTPEENLQKAQTVLAAALAPADPSGQDLAIAAQASQRAMKARMELAQQQMAERGYLFHRGEETPAGRLAQRFVSAITPKPQPFIQLAA
ncbi:MAG: catalase [Candidatus Competibacteraceae bacterium]|nr:catalase [Candidatus Competibacteraceae bacterium]